MGWAASNRKKLNRISKAEKEVALMLDGLNLFYHRNWGFQVKGGQYRFVDFFLRKHRLIIEVDGPEHREPKDREREEDIIKTFRKYTFLRFNNTEVFETPKTVMSRIKDET